MTVKILKAGNGDAILLNFQDDNISPKNILIDFGNKKEEYENHLREELKNIKKQGQFVDLAIITHMDEDHISGFEFLYEDFQKGNELSKEIIKEYWFNTFSSVKERFNISVRQVELLQTFLNSEPEYKWSINRIIEQSDNPIDRFGIKITILSPIIKTLKRFNEKYNIDTVSNGIHDDYNEDIETLMNKEISRIKQGKNDLDDTLENATSIAFLFEYNNVKILFLGDAIPRIIDQAIKEYLDRIGQKQLKVDYVKLSHHASRRSISLRFLELVEANNYIISTDGSKHRHPNKTTFAKILAHSNRDISKKINFIFNYGNVAENVFNNVNCDIDIEVEKKKYNFDYIGENYKHGYEF